MPTDTAFFPVVVTTPTSAVVKEIVPEGIAVQLPATYDPPFRVFEGQIPRSTVRPSVELGLLEYRYNQRKGRLQESPKVSRDEQPGLF